jgi:hypothetical protein
MHQVLRWSADLACAQFQLSGRPAVDDLRVSQVHDLLYLRTMLHAGIWMQLSVHNLRLFFYLYLLLSQPLEISVDYHCIPFE